MAAKPIALTQRAAVSGEPDPQPLVIVGTLPAAAIDPAANVAVDPSPADAAAVAADLEAVVSALIAAGLMAAA